MRSSEINRTGKSPSYSWGNRDPEKHSYHSTSEPSWQKNKTCKYVNIKYTSRTCFLFSHSGHFPLRKGEEPTRGFFTVAHKKCCDCVFLSCRLPPGWMVSKYEAVSNLLRTDDSGPDTLALALTSCVILNRSHNLQDKVFSSAKGQ